MKRAEIDNISANRMLGMDALGLDMTVAHSAATAHWDDVVEGALSHARSTPDSLAALFKADPNNVLGWSAKALFLVMLARPEMAAMARDAAAKAADLFAHRGGTAREGRYVAGALLAARGHWWQAIEEFEAIIDADPEDSLAAKLSHGFRFMLGDQRGMRRSIEAVINRVGRDHPHSGYLLGCRAFALEEMGEYAEAEAVGRIAVARAPRDAWGLHAVSHVFEMTGRADAGANWLTGREAAYAHCNNFGYHVFWHLALFRLELGDAAGALALYDERIRKDHTDDFRDVANAASLLARLELDGVAVGKRWEELAAIAERRVEDRCLVFADLHYLIALTGAGKDDAATDLAAGLLPGADGRISAQQQPALGPGALTAQGLIAFRQGDYTAAARNLMQARRELTMIGGSHAQRDVFEQFTLEALVRSGDRANAETLLQERVNRRGGRNLFAAKRLGALSGQEGQRIAALAAATTAPDID
jgi:tetratricopeptide (TPR) repeat protein